MKVTDKNRIRIRIKISATLHGHLSTLPLQMFNDDPCTFSPELNFCLANLDVSGELVPVGQPLPALRTRVRPEGVINCLSSR